MNFMLALMPPRGLPPPRRCVRLLASVVLVLACVGHGSLAHRRATEPHPSWVARVQQRCQAVKAACAPPGGGGPWPALTA